MYQRLATAEGAPGSEHLIVERRLADQLWPGASPIGQRVKLLSAGLRSASSRSLESLLFAVGPTDPATFASVAMLLAIVALAAAAIPTIRATRVDPMLALRSE